MYKNNLDSTKFIVSKREIISIQIWRIQNYKRGMGVVEGLIFIQRR